jgi:hypothetical protein
MWLAVAHENNRWLTNIGDFFFQGFGPNSNKCLWLDYARYTYCVFWEGRLVCLCNGVEVGRGKTAKPCSNLGLRFPQTLFLFVQSVSASNSGRYLTAFVDALRTASLACRTVRIVGIGSIMGSYAFRDTDTHFVHTHYSLNILNSSGTPLTVRCVVAFPMSLYVRLLRCLRWLHYDSWFQALSEKYPTNQPASEDMAKG